MPITPPAPDASAATGAVLRMAVTRTRRLADQVVGVRLEALDGADLPTWEAGAHLELLLPSGLVRQYSLCGDPVHRSAYEIAVLRVPDGRGGSREVHDRLGPGELVDVRGPRNHFGLVPQASRHLLLAGGIGVTPILAMARQLARAGADWHVVYGGRTLEAMALREELRGLDPGRVRLLPQDVHGVIDIADVLASAAPGTVAYVCGPPAMIDAASLAAAGSPHVVDLRFERFAAGPVASDPVPSDAASFEIDLRASGRSVTVSADTTVLDAIQGVRPDWPSSCREGYCGTCEVKVLEGEPDHRDDLLTEEERAAGTSMMPCVSRALSPRLVLDA